MSTLPKLWEISQELEQLESELSEVLESDLSEEEKEEKAGQLLTAWFRSGKNFKEKAVNVASYIKQLEALALARKEEAKRIRVLAEIAENKANSLRDYLLNEMLDAGITKIEGVTAKLSVRKKPSKLLLNCSIDDLPDKFKRVTVEPKLMDIRKELTTNPDIEWAALEDSNEFGLTIK